MTLQRPDKSRQHTSLQGVPSDEAIHLSYAIRIALEAVESLGRAEEPLAASNGCREYRALAAENDLILVPVIDAAAGAPANEGVH